MKQNAAKGSLPFASHLVFFITFGDLKGLITDMRKFSALFIALCLTLAGCKQSVSTVKEQDSSVL